ncbi:probable LRR receptor-like serine/threonine-protein kinase At3g47570 [Lycium barbarum]|uniref:probable LRR receptor-like serine/threonine-protein kinase At3g47570 n=1 Tax=Lycium barbarum TaxID=112863 RepID=UPI00293ED7D8|nr:probable LRR receptor-like serine/threonine-protein kinase At3g47570 [Lycium barbarum]
MERAYSFFLSTVVLQLYFLETCISKNITTDQSALLVFKDGFTLNSSHPLTRNWSSQASACHWIGVTCGSRHRRVRALNISDMGILGTIPPHLGNLSFLVSLDVSKNHLYGVIPREMGNLHKLEKLIMYSNKLSGYIQEELFNISTLREMDLSSNNLSGSLPSAPDYWRTNVQLLNLRANNIGGVIPSSISNSSNLKELYLHENKLSGQIPNSLGDLRQLEHLYLLYNNLTGNSQAKCFCLIIQASLASSMEVLDYRLHYYLYILMQR